MARIHESVKYAVKVPFEDGYLFIIDPCTDLDNMKPVLYNTRIEAEEAALIWGENAEVVEYDEKTC